MSRNGSNLSQVFISNAVVSNNQAMSAIASGVVGVLGEGTNNTDGAAADLYVDKPTGGTEQWVKSRVQFVQGRTTGNPLASPIINTRDIVRVDWKEHVTAVKAGNTTTDTISNTNNNTRFAIKVIVKYIGAINDYSEYANPTNAKELSDRTGEIRNYEYVSDATATAAEICQGLVDAVNADKGAAVTAALANTSDFTITAKEFGTSFQVIDDSDTAITVSAGAVTNIFKVHAPVVGVGNYAQALSDEKKTQGRYGHLNRLYLPKTAETFATKTWKYHVMDITYRHNHPNSTGIAPAGELNTIRIYIGDSSTAMIAGDTVLDNMFMDQAAVTDKTILFSA